MAKRKPNTRRKTNPGKTSTARKTAVGLPWSMIGKSLLAAACVVAALVLWTGGRGNDSRPAYPVVTLDDTPAAAVTKSHARYLLNWADSLEEFSDKADAFTASGDAAKWFADRTARARTDAFGGPDGFDAYVFGHAGGTNVGEDRYDPEALGRGAREMARACREAASRLAE